jgi:hypothetical protein
MVFPRLNFATALNSENAGTSFVSFWSIAASWSYYIRIGAPRRAPGAEALATVEGRLADVTKASLAFFEEASPCGARKNSKDEWQW